MGLRTVVGDYTRGGVRTVLTMVLYLGAIVLFALGTIVVVTLPSGPCRDAADDPVATTRS